MTLRLVLTTLVAAPLLAACAGDPGLQVVSEDPTNVPIAGLDPALQARHDEGDALFDQPFRDTQGLGPVFIRQACSDCHAADGRGPGAVQKMVFVEADGFTPRADQSPLMFGFTVRPRLAGGATLGITSPTGATGLLLTTRIGPPVFGRGYLEAVDDAQILAAEAAQAARTDGISGHVQRVRFTSEPNPGQPYHAYAHDQEGLIGRFGLKARIATIDDFTADAYQGDMGLTSPLRPTELPNPNGTDDAKPGVDLSLEDVNLVADYVRTLRLPRRVGLERDARLAADGAALFDRAQCSVCHVPSMRTRADYPIPQLAGVDAPVFTDLLVHDMGAALADGLREGTADSREWRTTPLVGMRFQRSFLHDGRARTVEQALLMHGEDGSEGQVSVDAFMRLTEAERQRLIAYVEAL